MNRFASTQNLLSIHKFPNAKNLHNYFPLLLICNSLTQLHVTHYFQTVSTAHNTRCSNVSLVCPQFTTVASTNNAPCSGPQIWNSRPVEIKNTLTAVTYLFKNKL